HDTLQVAADVTRQQWVPARAPDHLDHVPAGAEKRRLELLDDLAVAAHRTVEALQIAVDDEDQIVELLAHRHGERTHRFRFIHLAIATEGPDLAVRWRHQAAILQIADEAGLVDRHHRSQTHRHRRELPEVRHQPRMRIGRESVAADFLAKAAQLLLAQAPLEIGAPVDARGGVPLYVNRSEER